MLPEEQAIVWLKECAELDDRERFALLRAAHDPALLFTEFEKFSKNVLKEGQSGLYNSGLSLRRCQLDEVLSELERKNRFAVTIASDDYPEALKHVSSPPLVLYGEGNRALLQERKVCIVGSRVTPSWAEKTAEHISRELSQRFVIVTGIAEGGDAAAIAGALPSGNLISVLPTGLDECYPAAHAALKAKIAKRGLLLSEFPFREKVHKGSFHARNRILAGLSKAVLVVSAGVKSGALITANYAIEYGKDLFAFPYNVGAANGAGCNELIKKGAWLVTEPQDLFDAFGIAPPETKKAELSAQEARVLEVLAESGELHAAVIAERAGLKIHEAAAILSALELKSCVVKSGGNRYSAL